MDGVSVRLQPLAQRIAHSTVPLCERGRGGRVTPAGSGVLLQIDDRRYLLTASHVFENVVPSQPIFAIAGGKFVSLASGLRWRTRPKSQAARDPADLAVVQLPAKYEEWTGAGFIGLSDTDPLGADVELARTTAFLALGYPQSKQPKSVRSGPYAAFAYHFLTHREPIEAGNSMGAVPDQHIAVGYDRGGFVGAPGVSKMAKPLGMSGGGLWRVPFATRAAHPQAKLVGILIEYHAGQKVILASRIAEALHFLSALDTANARAIARHFPGIVAQAI